MGFDFTQVNKKMFEIPKDVDTYYTLKELNEVNVTKFEVNAFLKNKKSKFGETFMAYSGELNAFVNLPAHLNQQIEYLLKDNEAIKGIIEGMLTLRIKEYEHNGELCYSVIFENTPKEHTIKQNEDDNLPF